MGSLLGSLGTRSFCVTEGETQNIGGCLSDGPWVQRTGRRDQTAALSFPFPLGNSEFHDPLALSFLPPVWAPLSPFPSTSPFDQQPSPPPSVQPLQLRSCWLRSRQLLLSERVQRCCLGTNHHCPALSFPHSLGSAAKRGAWTGGGRPALPPGSSTSGRRVS